MRGCHVCQYEVTTASCDKALVSDGRRGELVLQHHTGVVSFSANKQSSLFLSHYCEICVNVFYDELISVRLPGCSLHTISAVQYVPSYSRTFGVPEHTCIGAYWPTHTNCVWTRSAGCCRLMGVWGCKRQGHQVANLQTLKPTENRRTRAKNRTTVWPLVITLLQSTSVCLPSVSALPTVIFRCRLIL